MTRETTTLRAYNAAAPQRQLPHENAAAAPSGDPSAAIFPPDEEPVDMAAVYILLGCLALSGLVIIGILIYCTSQYWRRKCFKRSSSNNLNNTRKDSSLKLASSYEDGYVNLRHVKQSKMSARSQKKHRRCGEGTSPTKVKLLDEHRGSFNSYSYAECEQDNGCALLTKAPSAGGDSEHDRLLKPSSMLYQNGVDLNCGGGSSGAPTKSILHYDIGYEKSHMSCFRGTLTFALRYDYIHRVLMVHVIRAQHLPAKAHSDKADPYLKMYLLPDRRNHCKTRIQKRTTDPEFNEMFSFEASYSSLASRMLQFTMYDFDRFARHDLVGNVIMRDLFEKSDLYSWTEYTMHIIASNDKDDYGDLLLHVTFDKDFSKVTFTVAKAYNLRPMDITGASDPYVKFYQLSGKKRIRKKRTTTKRQNLNPVYNESIVFEIDPQQLQTTNFLIKVMDWDRIGSDDLLGCAIIGPESPTLEGKDQWRHALASEGQPVGRWHALLAEVPEEFCNLTK